MPTTEPAIYVLYRREHRKRARWRKVATAGTRAELYGLMNGAADYHIAPLADVNLAGTVNTGAQTESTPDEGAT